MRKKLFTFLLLLSILSLLPACAGSDYALLIEGQPVSLTEANIYIITAEQAYADVAGYYEDYLGIDYWQLTYSNGMTVSEMIKSDIFEEIKAVNLFYAMALESGMRLTQEELNECRQDAEAAYRALSVTDSEKIDPDELSLVYEKQRLADRMYSVQLGNVPLDEDSVIRAIPKADYTQYDVEYLFRSFSDFDESGRQRPLTSAKRASIEAVFQNCGKFASLEEAAASDTSLDILYGKTTFLSGDATVDSRLIEAARGLEIGQYSEITETDHGLFILRLIDNTNASAYEKAVKQALFEAREAAFLPERTALMRKCQYEINVSVWRPLMPGANGK